MTANQMSKKRFWNFLRTLILGFLDVQHRKPRAWPHHQSRQRNVHNPGRHHQVDSLGFQIPDQPAYSSDTEVLRADNRHRVSTAGTDRTQDMPLVTQDRQRDGPLSPCSRRAADRIQECSILLFGSHSWVRA